MAERKKSAFDERITSERAILRGHQANGTDLPTAVRQLGGPTVPNPVPEEEIGAYRPSGARKLVTADAEVIAWHHEKGKEPPSFLEAGPRAKLFFDPQTVRAAILTCGGLAPGMNSVVHSIVTRHTNTYSINRSKKGAVLGVYDSLAGLLGRSDGWAELTPALTEGWLDHGGCELGTLRHPKLVEADYKRIADNLASNDLNILYVIGGDGSLTVAHNIALNAANISVVGIPKTMDNDILWVWQSFGFNTAVEKAAEVINTMHAEAQATRRVCILELFGAESGSVAANAALASGHVDLVMIPEAFLPLDPTQYEPLLNAYVEHVARRLREHRRAAHAVVVIAEGVGELFRQREVPLAGQPVRPKEFAGQLAALLQGKLKDRNGRVADVFLSQPRHYVRAIPANAYDRTYCARLGALAVDNALAGYTDFMISQWLTEYVLVPLELVTQGKKSIPPGGIFWKQVVETTGQPHLAAAKGG